MTSLLTSTLVKTFSLRKLSHKQALKVQGLSSGRVREAGSHTPALQELCVSWDTDMSVIELMKRDKGSDGPHHVAWAQSALTFTPSGCVPSKAEEFPKLKRKNFLCSALPVLRNLLHFKTTGARRVCFPSHTEHHSCGGMWFSGQWWRPLQARVTWRHYQGLVLGLCVRALGSTMLLSKTCQARA